MATIFPLSASVGQVYNGYEFDGVAWNIIGVDLTQDYALESEFAAHSVDTTNVHGITDTSLLATQSYAQTSASAAASSKAPIDSPTFTGTVKAPSISASGGIFSGSIINRGENQYLLGSTTEVATVISASSSSSSKTITVDGTAITQLRDTFSMYSPFSGQNALQWFYSSPVPQVDIDAVQSIVAGQQITVFDGTSTYTFTATGPGNVGEFSNDVLMIPGSGTSSGYYSTGAYASFSVSTTTIQTSSGDIDTATSGSSYIMIGKNIVATSGCTFNAGSISIGGSYITYPGDSVRTIVSTSGNTAGLTVPSAGSLKTLSYDMSNSKWQFDSNPVFVPTPSSGTYGQVLTTDGTSNYYWDSATLATGSFINNPTLTSPEEVVTVSATAATGTINFNLLSQGVLYYTSNSASNFIINFRGDASTTLNSMLSNGQSITALFLNTNGATAYYPTTFRIDGTGVTPRWSGGSAPTSGNANSIDAYSFSIIKTANATFTVLAGAARFA